MFQLNFHDLSKFIDDIFIRSNIEPRGITKENIFGLLFQKTHGLNGNIYFLLQYPPDHSSYNSVSQKGNVRLTLYILFWLICFIVYGTGNLLALVLVAQSYSSYSLGMARGSALVIKVNIVIVLLSIIFSKYLPFIIHKISASVIFVMAIVHTIGHMIYGLSVFNDFAAISGWLMNLIIVINIVFILLKSKKFNLFYYGHILLILVFIPLLCLHSVFTRYFGFPEIWLIVLLPSLLYVYVRYKRYHPKRTVITGYQITENIIELSFEKVIDYERGQYLYLNIPNISKLEYHPFSIVSMPLDSNMKVIINNVGDWTTKLFENINDITYINIDGPIRSKLENIVKYKKIILIASGIGITPFISTLRGLINTEVHFIFTSRDQYHFDLIPTPDNNVGSPRYYIHYTGIKNTNDKNYIENINNVVFEEFGMDMITGLESQTILSRPNWNRLFYQINSHNRCRTGVFFTGSSNVSKTIQKELTKYINFYYYEDTF